MAEDITRLLGNAVTLPPDLYAKINAREAVSSYVDGTKLYSIHHMRGAAELEQRWVLCLHHDNWAVLVWDYNSETWYSNKESHMGNEISPHLIGKVVLVDKGTMGNIACLGLTETVKRKLMEAAK